MSFDMLAEMDAGVEAICDEINQAVVQHDLNLHAGIGRQQRSQRGVQDRFGGVLDRRDADRAGRLVAQLRQCGQPGIEVGQSGGERLQQPLPRIGRSDAACRARQEPQAKPRFETAHDLAERRLGQPQPHGRTGEATFLRYREERGQVGHLFALHWQPLLIGPSNFSHLIAGRNGDHPLFVITRQERPMDDHRSETKQGGIASRRSFVTRTALAAAVLPLAAWSRAEAQPGQSASQDVRGVQKMKTRKLGALEVSQLGAGCMSISANYGPRGA